ncbi:MAG TPA: hypothetical protein VHP83_14825 [Aggregatilineaceae bacterium]|nr:hypothetical protein [Aggregatilineaceae bacterium]
MNRLRGVLFTSLLLWFVAYSNPITHAEPLTPTFVFYVITINADQTRIWEVNTATHESQAIFSLPTILRAAPRMVFPKSELQLLEEAVDHGAFDEAQLDVPVVGQSLRADVLSDGNILLWIMAGISNIPQGYALGYHQLLLLDPVTGLTTELLKLPQHPGFLEDWDCDPKITGTTPHLLPNPVLDLFAFTLEGIDRTCGQDHSHTYLVDYSVSRTTVSEFDDMEYLAWSPDGQHLAYVMRYTEEHVGEYYILPAANSVPQLIAQHYAHSKGMGWSMPIAWIDNDRLLYQYGDNSETPLELA